MPKVPFVSFQAIVDLLDRQSPELLESVRARFPTHSNFLQPGKWLGNEQVNESEEMLLIVLAEETISIARRECERINLLLLRRILASSRLRLGGSIVSSASSGGLIVALVQGAAQNVALATGALAFISSCLTVVAQYVEEYSGGQNSLKEMRNRIVGHIKETAEIEAEIKLANIRKDYSGLIPMIRKLNVAVASTRQIEVLVS